MIGLLVSIILLVLRLVGLNIPYWVISLPVMITAGFSLWLFIKAEVEYLRGLKNTEEEQE